MIIVRTYSRAVADRFAALDRVWVVGKKKLRFKMRPMFEGILERIYSGRFSQEILIFEAII
jgi:hypothetical protein